MHYTAKNLVFGRDFLKTVATALGDAPSDPLLDGAMLRLSKDPSFQPGSTTLIADLTDMEADFTGYAAGGVAFAPGDAVNIGTARVGVQSPVTFVAEAAVDPDPFVDNDVYGWWIDNGTLFIVGEKLAAPAVAEFNTPGDYLQLDVVLAFLLQLATGA